MLIIRKIAQENCSTVNFTIVKLNEAHAAQAERMFMHVCVCSVCVCVHECMNFSCMHK